MFWCVRQTVLVRECAAREKERRSTGIRYFIWPNRQNLCRIPVYVCAMRKMLIKPAKPFFHLPSTSYTNVTYVCVCIFQTIANYCCCMCFALGWNFFLRLCFSPFHSRQTSIEFISVCLLTMIYCRFTLFI